MKYMVIKDTREQQGWDFQPSTYCAGTTVATLKTGDYTLDAFQAVLCIERKANTGEFASNINDGRFDRELARMEAFQFSFMVLEFTMEDIMRFPINSGIPKSKWPELKVSSLYMLRRFMEFQLQYKTKIILAGSYGQDAARSIFKRVIEYDEQVRKRKRKTSRKY